MIDRKAVRIFKVHEEPSDFAYWQTQSHERRLEALESIRREFHGWQDESQPRLQRVYRVIDLK